MRWIRDCDRDEVKLFYLLNWSKTIKNIREKMMMRKKMFYSIAFFLFLILIISVLPAAHFQKTSWEIKGIWEGTLDLFSAKLRIVFKVTTKDGSLSASMDSPDQGATGIPVTSVVLKDDSVRFEVEMVRGYFRGKFSDDTTIVGDWNQSGYSFPLTLQKVEKVTEINRPQEPKKPYPYLEQEVEYENKQAGIKLAGTLTLPQSGEPFPAVILISGSGAQDRDETVFNHKPFLVLADYLTRRGIAVLRVDDRGVGGSTGNLRESTSRDLVGDVLAGIEFLKTRKEIDPKKIGLIGHSEGGMIAPMVAAESNDVAFIVLLAGTGLTGEEILYRQAALMLKAYGVDNELIAKNKKRQEKLFQVIRDVNDDSLALEQMIKISQDDLASMTDQEKQIIGLSEKNLKQQLKPLVSPWFRFFLFYDPKPALEKVKCPVLALNGEKDLQVPPGENLKAIEQSLKKGGNRDFQVRQLPGLNHLFQTAKTGTVQEYSQIEETISPTVLKIIGDWILQRVK